MNKLVIFDLDGTLINSLLDIRDNINLMLEKFGYPERSEEEIKRFIGDGAKKLVERSLPNGILADQVDKCLACYNDLYTNGGSPKTKLYDGIGETLLALKEKGYKLAILTNKPQETTNEVYKKYLAEYNFDMVVGQKKDKKTKPDPETTFEIIKELNADKKQTYFVGDGEADIRVANSAGIKSVAVLWGFRTKTQLKDAGAETFIRSPIELLQTIN